MLSLPFATGWLAVTRTTSIASSASEHGLSQPRDRDVEAHKKNRRSYKPIAVRTVFAEKPCQALKTLRAPTTGVTKPRPKLPLRLGTQARNWTQRVRLVVRCE